MKISKSFEIFAKEAPGFQQAFNQFIDTCGDISSLEEKTKHLSYISVLAATKKISGLPFHVYLAKNSGATREEIISAILISLPVTGIEAINALPIAIEAYDQN